jgi:glutamyl/glutaminyl-tRNA synthetase
MERISKGKDIADMAVNGELTYFFGKPAFDRDSLFFKSSKIPEENKYQILSDYLANAISIIQDIPIKDFTKENIKEKLWPYAEEIGRGDILWPIRYALSGLDKSPDPFIIASILGKNETISRLNAAIQILRA